MENNAYNDFQIFSPQVMEQLARAYFENRQSQNLELDDLLSSLNFLYSQLEKHAVQLVSIQGGEAHNVIPRDN